MATKIHRYSVYILSNKHNTVLYVGVTNNLIIRCQQHKSGEIEGFTKRYNIHKLVYFEDFTEILEAIKREKQVKKYSRAKKDALIDQFNPNREELFENGVIRNTNKNKQPGGKPEE